MTPIAPDVYLRRGAMPGEMRELLSYLQSLLGNEGRDEIHVLNMGLQALKPVLEKRKFGATSRPRLTQSLRNSNPRHIPAHVKREVWTRDGGQCTFVSSSGHRCEARRHLEFEHELEVARGGQATVTNIRLRSRAHNQLAAEQTYGAEFMRNKRIAAQEARELERETRRARTEAEREARRAERARTEEEKARAREAEELEKDPDRSVVPWLRALGISHPDARRAAKSVEHMTHATLEERVKMAARAFAPACVRTSAREAPARGA